MKKVLQLLLMMIFAIGSSFGQDRTVSGRITGPQGEDLPGVYVIVKGTPQGTVTDMEGKFKISVSGPNSVLIFSSIGYSTQEVTVGARSVIELQLAEDVKTLSEIVVTGYTTENRRDVTGAVATVKARDLQQIPSGNVEQQLQGRVTGVTLITNGQPGTNSIIRVRGFGAFGGNAPLYIVDGVPVGSTDFLSPDEIESTTILKDAAAASIYGARAANGVIIYTTKKGAKGAKKLQISYDGLFGITDPNVAGAPKMLSPQEQADWTHVAYRNNAAANGTQPAYNHPQYGNQAQATLPTYLHANGQNGVRGTVDMNAIRAAYEANPENTFLIRPNLEGTNWYDEITRTAPLMRHSLGFNGGTDNSRFFIGISAQEQAGILINNNFKRYSFRANSEFDIGKKVRIGENIQFTYRQVLGQAGGNNGLGIAESESEVLSAYRMPTVIPVYDEFGSFASTKAAGFNNPRNPVRRLMLNNGDDRNFNANAFGNVYMEVDPIENLTLRSSIGGQYNNYYFKDYNYRYLGDSEPEASNFFQEGSGYSFSWVFTNTASYKYKVGDHSINALVGIESLNTGVGRQMSGSGINPFSMDQNFVTLSAVQSPVVNSGLFNGVNFFSIFGKADYNYKETYYVTALLRRDGSSRFGPENRYGVFPAFSAAWRIINEGFMKGISGLSDLKIRGGYGIMGNSNNVNPSNQFSLFGTNRGASWYPIGGQSSGANEGYYRTRIGNPAAKWETSVTSNIGFDGTILDGKWEMVMDVWRKDTRDLLYSVPFPGVVGTGASAPAVNIGNMRNQGIDFQIINRGKITSDLRYELTINNSFLKNEITKIADDIDYFDGPAFRGIRPVRNQVGLPMSSFFGYVVDGFLNTPEEVQKARDMGQSGAGLGRFKYTDTNGDGRITPEDRTNLGSPVPKYTGGINLQLSYKNFDLNSFVYTSLGGKIFNMSKWFTDFHGTFEGSGKGERAKDSWTPALGNDAKAPIWESASNISTSGAENSWYVESGNFIRVQNLSIGYNLPNRLINNLGLSRARLAVSGNNFWTITKYQGLDPMVGGAVDTTFGVDVGNYPVTPSYNFVINLGF
jgi:TonB-dependent starch-binding outer membrane protein SusC